MTKCQLAYLAGIIDGEGTVNITYIGKRNEFRLRIQVVNTDIRLIEWLKSHAAGLSYTMGRESQKNPKWRKRYEWYLYPRKAVTPFLTSLLPYLICKKEQMKVAIEFLSTVGDLEGGRLTSTAYKTRQGCKARLNVLNRRGRHEDDASND